MTPSLILVALHTVLDVCIKLLREICDIQA